MAVTVVGGTNHPALLSPGFLELTKERRSTVVVPRFFPIVSDVCGYLRTATFVTHAPAPPKLSVGARKYFVAMYMAKKYGYEICK